jgi:hypothetical protein
VFGPVEAASVPTVEEFLRSAEARAIVATMYRTRIDEPHRSHVELRQAFVAAWGAQARDRAHGIDAYDLFDALQRGAEIVLERAVRDGVLAAHESLSARRHQETLARLDVIVANQATVARASETQLEAIDAFEDALREEIVKRSELVKPPSVRGRREAPMDAIYVNPSFGAQERTLQRDELIPQAHRLVVLGNPGAGKSTFARRLCLEVAKAETVGVAGAISLVLFVELRVYARETSEQPCGLREWIEQFIRTRMELVPPVGAIDQLLRRGRLGIVFDGLDELPQVARRGEIRDSIAAFGRRYPLAPVIVTSRLVGYEHASMPEPFQDVRLHDFDDGRVREYATRWFTYNHGGGDDAELAGRRDAEDFVLESNVAASDLRVNPLMLGLMCVLYRGQGYIPRNRPELYGQCATYLFETWDKHRGVEVVRPVEDLLRPALRHLASWIYASPDLQAGVSYTLAVAKTAGFLREQRFTDAVRADAAARDFIDFCRGRAWVFSDVGADAHDEDLFQFTHRTFLEFFAAEQLLNDLETTDQLYRKLRPKILRGEWEVVSELAVHMKQTARLGSADAILTRLLGSVADGDKARRARAFAARMLRNVALRPPTIATIVTEIMGGLANEARAISGSSSNEDDLVELLFDDALDVVSLLFTADAANSDVIAEAMRTNIAAWLTASDAVEVRLAHSWLHYAGFLVDRVSDSLHAEQYVYWHRTLKAIKDRLEPQLRFAVAETLELQLADAADRINSSDLSPADAVRQEGPAVLFAERRPLLFGKRRVWNSFFSDCLSDANDPRSTDDLVAALLAADMPWTDSLALEGLVKRQRLRWELDGDGAAFAAMALLTCAAIEPEVDGHSHSSVSQVRLRDSLEGDEVADDFGPSVLDVLALARSGRIEREELVEPVATLLAPGSEALDRLVAWAKGECAFVKRSL